MMRRGYESDDPDFASAVAASAHAMVSLEEMSSRPQIARDKTRKKESLKSQGGDIFFFFPFTISNVKILQGKKKKKKSIYLFG